VKNFKIIVGIRWLCCKTYCELSVLCTEWDWGSHYNYVHKTRIAPFHCFVRLLTHSGTAWQREIQRQLNMTPLLLRLRHKNDIQFFQCSHFDFRYKKIQISILFQLCTFLFDLRRINIIKFIWRRNRKDDFG
jgi:hypothetical protein